MVCNLEQRLRHSAPEGTSTLKDEWNESGILILSQFLVLKSLLASAELRGGKGAMGKMESGLSGGMDDGDIEEEEGLCEVTREDVGEVRASARIVHETWFDLSRSAGLTEEVAEEEGDGVVALGDRTPTETGAHEEVVRRLKRGSTEAVRWIVGRGREEKTQAESETKVLVAEDKFGAMRRGSEPERGTFLGEAGEVGLMRYWE